MARIVIPASTVALLERTKASLEEKAARSGVPPKAAQAAARRGLELRREFGRGGTMVGVARARDIQNGRELPEETIRRMKAYFDRHEVDKQGKDWDNDESPSNGKIAWLLWGGDSGRAWATGLVERWNKEKEKKSLPRWLPNGEPVTELKHVAAMLNIDIKTAAHVVLRSHNPSVHLLKAAERYVRTPAGAMHYGQPIGARIVKDRESWRGMVMQAARAGGITLHMGTGTQPTTGYVSARRGTNLEISESDFHEPGSTKAIMSWLRKHEKAFDDPLAHLGIWHDTENKEYVLDVSIVIEDRDEAVAFGSDNNQQSIWDIVNGEPIDVGGTGDRAALEKQDEKGLDIEATEANQRDVRRRTGSMGERPKEPGQRRRRPIRVVQATEIPQALKDVYAADRSAGVMKPVDGPVRAPFEILREADRPVTRRRRRPLSRIIDNREERGSV